MAAWIRSLFLGVLLLLALPSHAAFDHQQRAWTTLLARHVQWSRAGTANLVDYAGLGRDRKALAAYAAALGATPLVDYESWSWPRVLGLELAVRA